MLNTNHRADPGRTREPTADATSNKSVAKISSGFAFKKHPIEASKQMLPFIGPNTSFIWTITAKVPGQCVLVYRTSILDDRGIFQTGQFSYAQVTVHKPFDFVAAFHPYGIALIGLLGSVVGALIANLNRLNDGRSSGDTPAT